ncbi:PREDICTED: uncharacterized protein LOC109590763 [Amphimedon queenslandica]|nr:PREDICTED: uncharacterized protein LOC109590763 [Amphimedon queenslandica]|eukprot:XP_019862196.1 PREDICTED: uncharacterized protein LOC109590763 [Amphimedon queenslandica]
MYNVIGKLESDVTLLKENIGEYVSVIKSGATPVEVENKEILKAFTSDQVLQALDLLSLSQYKNTFSVKRVTGLELVQYNDTVLSQDLGMTSQSDRIRMMLFIEGREAVWKLLEAQSQATE